MPARAAVSPEAQPPWESPRAGPGQPARVPEVRTAPLPASLAPNRTASETRRKTGSRRPKAEDWGVEDAGVHGTMRPSGLAGRSRLLTSGARKRRNASNDARRKRRAAQRLKRVCAGQEGGRGMRRGRDAER